MKMFGNYNSYGSFMSPSPNPYTGGSQPFSSYDVAQNMMGQQPAQSQQNTNIIFVNGMEGAKAYQLRPNSSVILMDSDNSKFYVKSTDNLGCPKLTSYSFMEDEISAVKPEQTAVTADITNQIAAEVNSVNAKVADLEKFKAMVENKLGDLLADG